MSTTLVSPRTSLILKLTRNEWSDKARAASAKKRKEKAQQKGSWWGTAGKAALIGGGALAGAALGARTLSRLLPRGRAVKAGENLIGKIVYTASSKKGGSFTPSTLIRVGKNQNRLDQVIAKASTKGGVKGRLARAAKKVDEFFEIPEGHYGVGVGRNKVADLSPITGQKVRGQGQFARTWDKKKPNLRIVDEGKIAKKSGKARKEEIAKMRARLAGKKGQNRYSWHCAGNNCETFARGVGTGKSVSYEARAIKHGAAGGAALGAAPGTALMIPRKKKGDQVHNILQVINGGPGSGHHGHKGIPGQRGGSLPEGASAPSGRQYTRELRALIPAAPVSETPQARAKRIKNVYTKASRLADVYEAYAGELEKKRWNKLLPLKKAQVEELARVHAKAAENFYSSADQATLLKGRTPEEQIDRLRKADHHAQLAMKYTKRLGYNPTTGRPLPKSAMGEFTRSVGKAFVAGLTGGVQEAAYKAGRSTVRTGLDVAGEAVRGGIRGGQESASEGSGIAEILKSIAKGTGSAAKERATAHKEAFLNRPSYDQRAEIARDYNRSLRVAREMVARAMKEAEMTVRGEGRRNKGSSRSTVSPSKPVTESSVVGSALAAAAREIRERRAKGEENIDAEEVVAKYTKQFQTFSLENALTFNEQITANLSGSVRRETLHGKEFLVAPLSMIVPGVLPGSKGPLLYPEEEVRKNPSAWNNIPIVVNHPMKDGIPVEARSPDILERYQIGTVFNAKYNGKLIAEGWFDVERTRKVNTGVYDMLLNGRPIELSTGLYTDNEPFEGVHNGREYKFIARNYRPDHLAILLTSKGACSLKDGCGVLINKKRVTANIVHKIKGGYRLVSHKGKNLGTAKTKAGIMKRERQVEYFKHVKNEQVSPEIQSLVDNIAYARLAKPWRAVASHLGSAARIAGTELKPAIKSSIKNPVKATKSAGSRAVAFTKKHPKTALGITGVAAYKYGRRKERKKQAVRNELSPKIKKRFKQAAGFAGGLGAGAAGTAIGAGVGSLVAPGVGTIIGGGIGAGVGGYLAHRTAKKFGGKSAAGAAGWGSLAGSVVSPTSMATRLAGRLTGRAATKAVAGKVGRSALSKMGRSIKAGRFNVAAKRTKLVGKAAFRAAPAFAGRQVADAGSYAGTDAGLRKVFDPTKATKKPKPVRNAWTDAARQKSAETRKRNAAARSGAAGNVGPLTPSHSGLAIKGLAAGATIGSITGRFSTRLIEPEIDLTIEKIRTGLKGSFKNVKRNPGFGRRLINLLKRVKLRRI